MSIVCLASHDVDYTATVIAGIAMKIEDCAVTTAKGVVCLMAS